MKATRWSVRNEVGCPGAVRRWTGVWLALWVGAAALKPLAAEAPAGLVLEEPLVSRFLARAMHSSLAYPRLAELCDRFGARFSGTTNLEGAIDWALDTLKEDGFEAVRGEPVMVPHWVRGEESLEQGRPSP